MNLIDAIRHHARVRPYDMAVIHPAGSANYLQLASIATAVSARLRGQGIAPGMTVGVFVRDPFLHLALLLAAMAAGAASASAPPDLEPIPPGLKIDAFLADDTLPFAPDARVIPQLHAREAAELAYYGAKVLHPRALIPVTGRRIPVFVRPFADPDSAGTEVSERVGAGRKPVKALTAAGGPGPRHRHRQRDAGRAGHRRAYLRLPPWPADLGLPDLPGLVGALHLLQRPRAVRGRRAGCPGARVS